MNEQESNPREIKPLTPAQRCFDALKRISQYQTPERVKMGAKNMGLDENEAVEMAYENVLAEASTAIKGMRRPK